MTKKHFKAIADIIRDAKAKQRATGYADTTYVFIGGRLADYFENINPKFNRGKFIDACYR